jgi:hypothetical protein
MMSAFNLQAMFEAAELPSPTGLPRLERDIDRGRLALAVRGWVEPLHVLEPLFGADGSPRVLSALACEVETAVESRPGQWYLSVPARRRAFAGKNRGDILSALRPPTPFDGGDPVHVAMEYALGGTEINLHKLDAVQLAALGQVLDWLGDGGGFPIEPLQIANEMAARTLDDDLARMTAMPLVGAAHQRALGVLTDFATRAISAPVSATYVFGGGGAGKTTLLAYLQRQLMSETPPVAVARIDFDEPALDPTRMVTLNLALVEQLARTLPSIAARISAMLPMLRRTALVQRDALVGLDPDGRRSGRPDKTPNIAQESIVSESMSDEGSILFGMLDRDTVGGPVVIVLDTAELVVAHSDRIASSLAAWIRFLQLEARASDVRLIIAGRDPPPDQAEFSFADDNLLSRLQRQDVVFDAAIGLPELTVDEAAVLLRHCGIEDEHVIRSAACAVPGNPLLLRITGDALRQGDDSLRESVLQSHRQNRVDPASARNYLMRRIVAHVSDPLARPYVLAAMYSPYLTTALLEQAIIPATDRHHLAGDPSPHPAVPDTGDPNNVRRARRKLAERVFRSLSGTYWLTRPSLNSDVVPLNRDIRAFALQLLSAAEGGAGLERDVRQSLEIFHLRRRADLDRAMAFYHAAVLGHAFRIPRRVDALEPWLRDVLDELPLPLRDKLLNDPDLAAVSDSAAPDFAERMSDADWRTYLEGDAKRDGEGMLLVNDDRASEALKLYRKRPTGAKGRPPTFVIRAMADLGDWSNKMVDLKAIVTEEANRWLRSKGPDAGALTRLYWLTRLALLKPGTKLPSPLVELLRSVPANANTSGAATLAGLIAVAEAQTGLEILNPEMRRAAQGTPDEGRIFLAAKGRLKQSRLQIRASQVVVTQRNWVDAISAYPEVVDIRRLADLRDRLEGLHGRPIAEVNQLFESELKPIEIDWDGKRMAPAILLLRGLTNEFLRPLREALLVYCGDGIAGPRTRSLFLPILDCMTIRPAELEPETFIDRLEHNPSAWCSAFVSYADRSRLLPSLCEELMKFGTVGRDAMPHRIARSFLEWDRALCAGGSSDWSRFLSNNKERSPQA